MKLSTEKAHWIAIIIGTACIVAYYGTIIYLIYAIGTSNFAHRVMSKVYREVNQWAGEK